MGLDIHAIILQLIQVSLPKDKRYREEHIKNLTPINRVSEGPTPQGEPEFSFYVSKIEPKESKFIYNDLKTTIVSELIYKHYMDLPSNEFLRRFNKTIYEYIFKQINEAKERNVPDEDNLWIQPNIAFVNWFQENGIEIDTEVSLLTVNQHDEDEEYYLKRDCTKTQLLYIKLFKLTKEYIKYHPRTTDGAEMSIRKATKIVYDENKDIFPDWADSSLNKLYHLGIDLTVTI